MLTTEVFSSRQEVSEDESSSVVERCRVELATRWSTAAAAGASHKGSLTFDMDGSDVLPGIAS